ncbi:unnamed protein product [Adineta ricciae]|uniref:Uncharacterized protein n=1 Tax=Adineta ricciae TaxID=249248 RepID=A0A815Q3X1_ADIRI|nr:unnamed protein product [Adineta ricciae]
MDHTLTINNDLHSADNNKHEERITSQETVCRSSNIKTKMLDNFYDYNYFDCANRGFSSNNHFHNEEEKCDRGINK